MGRFQRMVRFAAVLAGLAGMLGWQGLVVGSPASAAPTLRGVNCRLSSGLSGAWVAVCPSGSSTSITICSLIPGYLRRWPAPQGQQWAVLDCPGPDPFGGLILMPDGHPSTGTTV